jgi:hypothetical protein
MVDLLSIFACFLSSYLHYLHSLWLISIARLARPTGIWFLSTAIKRNVTGPQDCAPMTQTTPPKQRLYAQKWKLRSTGALQIVAGTHACRMARRPRPSPQPTSRINLGPYAARIEAIQA